LDAFYRDFARRQEELRSATVFRSEDAGEVIDPGRQHSPADHIR
jgi:hypothetical protein